MVKMSENLGYRLKLEVELDSKSSKDFFNCITPDINKEYKVSIKGSFVEIEFFVKDSEDFDAKCAGLSKYLRLFEKAGNVVKKGDSE
jgi:hypothetical protein